MELYKIKRELADLVMVSGISKRNSLETLSYCATQLYIFLPEELKQRNPANIFKSDVRKWICNESNSRFCKTFVLNLQSFEKYLRQDQCFIWSNALLEAFNLCF